MPLSIKNIFGELVISVRFPPTYGGRSFYMSEAPSEYSGLLYSLISRVNLYYKSTLAWLIWNINQNWGG